MNTRKTIALGLLLVVILLLGLVALMTYQNIQASSNAVRDVVLTRAEQAAETAVKAYDLTHSP